MPNHSKKESRMNTRWNTSGGKGRECVVVDYKDIKNVIVEFPCGNKKRVSWNALITGEVKDEGSPSVFGVGYFGFGKYSHREHPNIYTAWHHMIRRCYDKSDKSYPTYTGIVTVSEEFKNFQTFAAWAIQQKSITLEKPALDKDLLLKGNKVYSAETCCFVPQEVNSLLTLRGNDRGEFPLGVTYRKKEGRFLAQCNIEGKRKWLGLHDTPEQAFETYKIAKEAEIKRIADKWRGYIEDDVYQALMSYQVDITD